jgi:hypothetical protein
MDSSVPWGSLVLGGLAVWRLTHLLHAEAGPWDVVRAFRRRVQHTALAGVMGCFYCLSLWVAAPLSALTASGWRDGVLLWLALSTIAIAVDALITAGRPPVPAYEERLTGENDNGLLRGRGKHASGSESDSDDGFSRADPGPAQRAAGGRHGVYRREGAERRGAGYG